VIRGPSTQGPRERRICGKQDHKVRGVCGTVLRANEQS
jgi:hypothetical protein